VDSPAELGRYRILGEIGRGASGTVYHALDTLIGREVAIKSFRLSEAAAAAGSRENLREELLREARSAGMLSHPNVVTLYDVVESADGSFFIAMEYVEGRSLADVVAEGGPPDFERAVDWISQVAAALDYLHARGLVHRDVKPANILITDGGRVKLTDFGIAVPGPGAASDGGDAVLGTPNYMAPEQILGRELTPRADVWSLGVVLYELLSGRRPFEGRTVAEVVHRVVHEPAPPPGEDSGLAPGVRPLLERAMAKDPRWRFASAGELARELRQILYQAAAAVGESESEADMLERTLVSGLTPAAAPAPGPASARSGLPRAVRAAGAAGRRLSGPSAAASAVLVAVALAGLVYLAYRWLDLGPGAPAELDPTVFALEGPTLEAHRLLREGKRLLAAGDAEGAALFFEVVQRLEPNLPEPDRITRLRSEAEAEARGLAADLETARSALADREARELVASARRRVPAGEGESRDAIAALDLAGETLAAAGAAGEEPAPGGDGAGVRLEFTSDSPEGAITLYAEGQQLLRRGFSYYERSWWLGRTASTGGFEQDLTVPPGAEGLWVYVARANGPAQRLEIPGRFPRGSRTTLRIHLPAEGEATAAWE